MTAALVALLAVLLAAPDPAQAMVPPGAHGVATAPLGVSSEGQRYLLPDHAGTGRRVVYSQRTMHVWAVDGRGHVVRDWKVSGRPDWPRAGTYHVFSKALWSRSAVEDVGFRWMVRFAHGHSTPIGFHNIPYNHAGRPIQSTRQLGSPVDGGGCIRSADRDAEWLYRWARVGTTVVVVP